MQISRFLAIAVVASLLAVSALSSGDVTDVYSGVITGRIFVDDPAGDGTDVPCTICEVEVWHDNEGTLEDVLMGETVTDALGSFSMGYQFVGVVGDALKPYLRVTLEDDDVVVTHSPLDDPRSAPVVIQSPKDLAQGECGPVLGACTVIWEIGKGSDSARLSRFEYVKAAAQKFQQEIGESAGLSRLH